MRKPSALDALVRQGKALYVGPSSYSPERTAQAACVAKDLVTPLVIHQPSSAMPNRWVEDSLLDTLAEHGMDPLPSPRWPRAC